MFWSVTLISGHQLLNYRGPSYTLYKSSNFFALEKTAAPEVQICFRLICSNISPFKVSPLSFANHKTTLPVFTIEDPKTDGEVNEWASEDSRQPNSMTGLYFFFLV